MNNDIYTPFSSGDMTSFFNVLLLWSTIGVLRSKSATQPLCTTVYKSSSLLYDSVTCIPGYIVTSCGYTQSILSSIHGIEARETLCLFARASDNNAACTVYARCCLFTDVTCSTTSIMGFGSGGTLSSYYRNIGQ